MKRIKTYVSLSFIVVLLILVVAPGLMDAQTHNFTLGPVYGAREEFNFEVATTGTIKVRAVWTGTAGKLALILNGPGQVGYYQRIDGSSPLEVSQMVSPEILSRGTQWKASIVNFNGGAALGQLRIEYPSGELASVHTNFDRLALVKVEKTHNQAFITVDYTLSHTHSQDVYLGAYVLANKDRSPYFGYVPVRLTPGSGQVRVEVNYQFNNPPATMISDQIEVGLREGSGEYYCRAIHDLRLVWLR